MSRFIHRFAALTPLALTVLALTLPALGCGGDDAVEPHTTADAAANDTAGGETSLGDVAGTDATGGTDADTAGGDDTAEPDVTGDVTGDDTAADAVDPCPGGGCECQQDLDCAVKEDGNVCNGTLVCDTGALPFKCVVDPKTIVQCDASVNNACRTNLCDPAEGKCKIVKQTDGSTCDADANVCTENDSCQDGFCVAGKVKSCDDGNPCTDEPCDPQGGCSPLPNTAPCDADGDACTVNDTCADSKCVAGAAKACDDGEACTKDGCDGQSGTCTVENLSQSCSDDDACTSGDTCGANAQGAWTCVGGGPTGCDDGNVCTQDACDAVKGCTYAADTAFSQACYTGPEGTKGIGTGKGGTQKCDADAKLGTCAGEVVPAAKEACDGLDDDCDGVTDEGCAPTAVKVRFGSARLQGQSVGGTWRVGAGFAASTGEAKAQAGGQHDALLGFWRWVSKL